MQANYGVDNAMEIPEFKRKIKETKLKRYNDENYNNTPKARETSLQRFGVPVAIQLPEVKEKAAQTNIQRYGAIAITCTDAGKAKVKSTKEKRYGNPYYCNIEKSRETKLERYGYECEFKDLDFRRKYNGKTSKIENKLCTLLDGEPKFICGGYEYDFLVSVKEGKVKRIRINAGEFKSYDIPIVVFDLKTVWFYFQSDDVIEVERLIKTHLYGIGKKTAYGYGEVTGFTIDKIDFDPFVNSVIRPIPIEPTDLTNGKNIKSKIMTWKPPYWLPENQTFCIAPQ